MGILVIVAVSAYALIWIVRDTTRSALQPVQDVAGNLGTRVAEVLNPTPTVLPSPLTIIHDVRALARLETIQFTVEKVITAEVGQGVFGFLFGDRLLFVAHGVVIAGVDLGKLQPQDLWIQDGVLFVRLPDAEIFVATLDNDESYVFDRDTGALSRGDINLETAARRVAEDEIEKAALEDGILDLARQNAENFFSILLRDLGYPEVIYFRATPEPLLDPDD